MTPDSTNFGEFLQQISGLLALTCGAGVLWIILMAVVFQRAAERKRRAAQGLEPLPGIHTAVAQWVMKQVRPAPAAPMPTEYEIVAEPPRVTPLSAQAPDLSLLLGDLSEPEPEPETESVYEPAPPTYEEPPAAYEEQEPVSPAAFEAAADETPPGDAVELLRVWRDLSDGSLIVEIGGRRFTSLRELRSADLERRFLSVVRDLDAMTRPKTSAPAAPSAPKDADLTADMTRGGSMLRQMTRVAMGQAPISGEAPTQRTIADQIEDLLQARLAELPSLRTRKIHVRPSPEGGVRIEIDGTFYEGIGDVDDPEVRDLLLDVVREWESQQ